MTEQQEAAMRQALEALENGMKFVWTDPERDAGFNAITALRQALEQQPIQCWKCGDMDAEFQAKCTVPACGMKEQQPADEPVYQVQGADGKWTDTTKSSHEYNAKHPGNRVRTLYTRPQPADADEARYKEVIEGVRKLWDDRRKTKQQPAVSDERTNDEPVAWAISYDGKTPYSLWLDGDGPLLDLEVKRQGGTTCKIPLYTRPAERKFEETSHQPAVQLTGLDMYLDPNDDLKPKPYPQPAAWVSLTAADRKEIERQSVYVEGAIRMTDAKLREKNGGKA